MSSQLHLIEDLRAIWSDDRGRPGKRLSWGLFHCTLFRKVAAGDAPVTTMEIFRSLSCRYQDGSQIFWGVCR